MAKQMTKSSTIITAIAWLCILTPTTIYAEHKVTQADIDNAKNMRAMAVNMGLDKIPPEKMMEIGEGMIGDDLKKEFTPEMKAALVCSVRKAQEMQFKSPIETYARFITDEEFEEATMAKFHKECGLDDLVEK